jgi:hypothetical protein
MVGMGGQEFTSALLHLLSSNTVVISRRLSRLEFGTSSFFRHTINASKNSAGHS